MELVKNNLSQDSASAVPTPSPPPPIGDDQDRHARDEGHDDHHDDGDEAGREALHGELGGLLVQVVDERALHLQGLAAHAQVQAAAAREQRLALDVPLEVVGGVRDVHVAGGLVGRVLAQLDLDGRPLVVHGRHEPGAQQVALAEEPAQLGVQLGAVEGARGRAVAQVQEDVVGAHQLVAAQAAVALVGAAHAHRVHAPAHRRLVALARLEAAVAVAVGVVQPVVVQQRVLAGPHERAAALGSRARLEQQALGGERGAVQRGVRARQVAPAAAAGAVGAAQRHLVGGARAVALRGRGAGRRRQEQEQRRQQQQQRREEPPGNG